MPWGDYQGFDWISCILTTPTHRIYTRVKPDMKKEEAKYTILHEVSNGIDSFEVFRNKKPIEYSVYLDVDDFPGTSQSNPYLSLEFALYAIEQSKLQDKAKERDGSEWMDDKGNVIEMTPKEIILEKATSCDFWCAVMAVAFVVAVAANHFFKFSL